MDWLASAYDLLRGLHILAVIAWMAGLLYLPRLFAYHAAATAGSELDITFQRMELRLLRIVMNPAMIAAWIFGLLLLTARGWSTLAEPWMWGKLAGVLILTAWHAYLGTSRKRFAAGANRRSERFWRMSNELPFLAAILIVLSVTLEYGTGLLT